jgi:hypothetical protein
LVCASSSGRPAVVGVGVGRGLRRRSSQLVGSCGLCTAGSGQAASVRSRLPARSGNVRTRSSLSLTFHTALTPATQHTHTLTQALTQALRAPPRRWVKGEEAASRSSTARKEGNGALRLSWHLCIVPAPKGIQPCGPQAPVAVSRDHTQLPRCHGGCQQASRNAVYVDSC